MRRLLPLPFLLLAAGPALAAARQATNWPAVMSFGFFVVAALYVSKWAAAKSRAAADVYAVGGGLSGFQNGLAIAGDYMSAASFLGISAAVMVYGYDGLMYSIGFLVGWPIVTFLMAERLRNLGKFTFADVAGYRFRQGPIRAFAAVSTLIVVAFYLVAQMVGAGHLIRLLFGLEYWMAVLIVGALMMAYVLAGGMSSTTWVQIIKAVMLLAGATFMAFMVLLHFGFSPEAMFARAIEIKTQLAAQELRAVALDAGLGREAATVLGASGAAMAGRSVMAPGNFLGDPLSAISFGIALMCGTAGLPHVLIRFFTVPNAKEARKSVFWATTWIGYFYLLTIIIGFGAIAFVLTAPEFLDGEGQLIGGANMAAVNLARAVGGNLFFGFIAAVAFATILAVVAGLTLSGASAVSHDLYATLVCRNGIEADTEVRVSRLTTLVLGLVAVVLGIAFEQQNIAYLVSLAFAVAASANFPVLFMAVLWRDCTTRGAVVGGSIGLATSLLLVVASPAIWEEVLGHQAGSALFPYASPCLFSMAAGFAGVWLFSRLDRSEQAQRERLAFRDQEIRSETGIGVVSARVR